jgi:hypothetical protein
MKQQGDYLAVNEGGQDTQLVKLNLWGLQSK